MQLGSQKTVVISNWEVARECFTIQDKVFPSRPRSLAIKIMGYDHVVLGFMPYGPNWCDKRKIATSELLSSRRLDLLRHVRESEVSLFTRELYEQWISKGEGSMAVVELNDRFGDLTMNIIVRMLAGKRYLALLGIKIRIQVDFRRRLRIS